MSKKDIKLKFKNHYLKLKFNMDNFSTINHASSDNVDKKRVDSPTDLSGKTTGPDDGVTNAVEELSEEI